jgi:tetratricopeptide (TPR) repeat protein
MSRGNKRSRKQKRQRLQRTELAQRRKPGASSAADACDRAKAFIERDQWSEARKTLEEYERANPGRREVLVALLDIYHEQRDHGPYCDTCRRLIKQEPDTPVLHLMLASGYLNDARPISALRTVEGFLRRWPDDPLAHDARKLLDQLAPAVETFLSDTPFPRDHRLEFAALHEDVLASLNAGDWRRTIQIGEQLLARYPDFSPAMNNVSEAYFRAGQSETAIGMSRRVLRQQADNIHALANLTRYLFLTGQLGEAKELAERVQVAPAQGADAWCKKCEALSFLGDFEAVLSVFADAVRAGVPNEQTPACALLFHLAAVAFARRGNQKEANHYWRKALKIQPGLEFAKDNLADAAKPVGERHGPWSFSLNYWVRPTSLVALSGLRKPATRERGGDDGEQALSRFADAHPEVVDLVPALLDRGDEIGREFAWRLAFFLETPEMLQALREFCLSQHGPDAMRMETANRLRSAGVLPPGAVRLWLDGQWRDIKLLGFEVTNEPDRDLHSPQVNDWLYEGCQALGRGEAVKAEALFRKCIELEGESPDLLNNLAAAYDRQGRTDLSHQLGRRIHERWPDYFFGRIAVANLATAAGNLDLAERYLEPLESQQRFHITEFKALVSARIVLLLAKQEVNSAKNWLEMWRRIDPDDPQLRAYELRCHSASLRGVMRNLLFAR